MINEEKWHLLKDERKIMRSLVHSFDLIIVEELVRDLKNL